MIDWISVNDRLPDAEVPVLVSDGKIVATAKYRVEKQSYWEQVDDTTQKLRAEDSKYWSFSDADWFAVTHWMPLPDPPTSASSPS